MAEHRGPPQPNAECAQTATKSSRPRLWRSKSPAPGENLNRRHARKRRNLLKKQLIFFTEHGNRRWTAKSAKCHQALPRQMRHFSRQPAVSVHSTKPAEAMRSLTDHARLPPGRLKLKMNWGSTNKAVVRTNRTPTAHLPQSYCAGQAKHKDHRDRPGAVPHSVKAAGISAGRRLWLCMCSPELNLWLLGLSKVLFVLSH
jgi:hypothetical protein